MTFKLQASLQINRALTEPRENRINKNDTGLLKLKQSVALTS
jgi:hypothetical protein